MGENREDASAAKRLLEVLAEVNRSLRDHAIELRRSRDVKSAQASMEIMSYKTGPVLEGYVDAELTNGNSICWCLDVRWNEESWNIEATLDRKCGDRQETIRELPPVSVRDFDSFVEGLTATVRDLLALRLEPSKLAEPENEPS